MLELIQGELNSKIFASIVVLIIVFIVYPLIAHLILKSNVTRSKIKKHNRVLMKRLTNLIIWTFCFLVLVAIWNIGFDNLWTTITGLLALIAIGFVAVWSIFSNIIAGFILFFSKSFEIGHVIKILPEDITGEITEINTMFICLKTKKGETINIPNNLLFQRITLTLNP